MFSQLRHQILRPFAVPLLNKRGIAFNGQKIATLHIPILQIFSNHYVIHTSHAKKHKKTRPSRARRPWLTHELLDMIKQKHALYPKFVQSREEAWLREFNKYRNSLTNKLMNAKYAYFLGIFSDPANQQSDALWCKLNALLQLNSNSAILDILHHDGQQLSRDTYSV